MDGLEDIRDVGLECREWFLVKLDAARAGLLQVGDHFPDSWFEDFGLYV